MKFSSLLLALAGALTACGDSTGPKPVPDTEIDPSTLSAHDGLIRFTLASNCPAMTVAFGVDQFTFGPEDLNPSESQDYIVGEGIHATSGKSFPNATVTFPSQNVTVVGRQRVVRTLSC